MSILGYSSFAEVYRDICVILILYSAFYRFYSRRKFNHALKKYNKVGMSCGLSGSTVARIILNKNGMETMDIQSVKGNYTDYYDPTDRYVALSDVVSGNCSATSIAVAAHEVGHAIQHNERYKPYGVRTIAIKISVVSEKIFLFLLLFGRSLYAENIKVTVSMMTCMCILLCLNYVTAVVERDATKRGLNDLDELGYINGTKEKKATKAVLDAAYGTYHAHFLLSLCMVMYHIYLLNPV